MAQPVKDRWQAVLVVTSEHVWVSGTPLDGLHGLHPAAERARLVGCMSVALWWVGPTPGAHLALFAAGVWLCITTAYRTTGARWTGAMVACGLEGATLVARIPGAESSIHACGDVGAWREQLRRTRGYDELRSALVQPVQSCCDSSSGCVYGPLVR